MAIFDVIRKHIKGIVKAHEPLKPYTSMKIGGPADLLVIPERKEDLKWMLTFIRKEGLRSLVMGNGSNLIFDDRGYRGIIIKTNTCLSQMQINGGSIFAGSGMGLMELVLAAAERGLSCLEQLAGIPGTVGGAIWMNAGAFNKEIQDCITDVHYIDADGNEKAQTPAFEYRKSPFRRGDIILGGHFCFERRKREALLTMIEDIQRKRAERQPLEFPSAGSVFKNPPDRFAGEIIDRMGMKGMREGDAEVSEKHANFIINRGNATCDDVRRLIDGIREQVRREQGIELELEVEFVRAQEKETTE